MQYSIIQYNKIESISKRIDAEYYKSEFLNAENILLSKNHAPLKNLIKNIRSFGAYSLCNQFEYRDYGIPFIRCQNILDGFIDFSNVLFIDENAHKLLRKSEIKPLNVLITMSGSVGNAAIAFNGLNYPINSNQDVAKISVNNKIDPFYLTVFLNSKYGKLQTHKLPIGSIQKHIFLWQFSNLIIPLYDILFQKYIRKTYIDAYKLQNNSNKLYKDAENLLLSELNLLNWKPKHYLSFVKNYSDTEDSGRFDAEYFQPKYDEIVEAVKKYKGGWDKLGNIVSIKKCIEVGADEYLNEGIPFIRVSNISPFEITNEKFITEKLYNELKSHQPKKGEILLSKDATPGIAYLINTNPDKMIPSSGILRLKLKDERINEEYLTNILNSIIVKEQIHRDVGGSVILHWRPDQVANIYIPILEKKKQEIIREKIVEATTFRQKSKSLLEIAKKGVEMAIEKDENIALKWIEKEVKQLEINL